MGLRSLPRLHSRMWRMLHLARLLALLSARMLLITRVLLHYGALLGRADRSGPRRTHLHTCGPRALCHCETGGLTRWMSGVLVRVDGRRGAVDGKARVLEMRGWGHVVAWLGGGHCRALLRLLRLLGCSGLLLRLLNLLLLLLSSGNSLCGGLLLLSRELLLLLRLLLLGHLNLLSLLLL